MKIDCGKRHRKKQQWHKWFAWYPVTVCTIPPTCCWLETVWRKGTYHTSCYDDWWEWKYMEIR